MRLIIVIATLVLIIATVVWADIPPAGYEHYQYLYDGYLDAQASGEAQIVEVAERYFLEWTTAGAYDSQTDTYAAVKDTVELSAAEVVNRLNQLLADSTRVANEMAEVRAVIASVQSGE